MTKFEKQKDIPRSYITSVWLAEKPYKKLYVWLLLGDLIKFDKLPIRTFTYQLRFYIGAWF